MRVNRSELAKIMGWSLPTVDARVREGMPYLAKPSGKNKGTWDFESADCIKWLVEKAGEPVQRNPQAEVALRTAMAEATLKEIQVMEKQRTLVPVADVVKMVGESVAVLKSLVTALPGRLAQPVSAESDPAEVLRLIRAEVNKTLKQISSFYLEKAALVIEPEEPEAEPPKEEDPYDGY